MKNTHNQNREKGRPRLKKSQLKVRQSVSFPPDLLERLRRRRERRGESISSQVEIALRQWIDAGGKNGMMHAG